jgi:nucleotide-binding universal stress UspA family protein
MKLDIEYRNILVPIDFTDTSRLAFYTALKIARLHDAHAFVLHVMQPLGTGESDATVERATEELERLEEGVKRRINELFEDGGLMEVDRRKVHVDFQAGDVATEVLKASKERNCDLVVMGVDPQKRRGLKKLLPVGTSPTMKVAERADCHVLVVKAPDYEYVPDDHIPEKFKKV